MPAKKSPVKKQLSKAKAAQKRTREITGIAIVGIGLFLFVALFIQSAGWLGDAFGEMLLGLLGMFAYLSPFVCVIVGILVAISFNRKIHGGKIAMIAALSICLVTMAHLVWYYEFDASGYLAYIADSYAYSSAVHLAAGALGAVFAYPLQFLLDVVGAWIFLVTLCAILLVVLLRLSFDGAGKRLQARVEQRLAAARRTDEIAHEADDEYPPPKSGLFVDQLKEPQQRRRGKRTVADSEQDMLPLNDFQIRASVNVAQEAYAADPPPEAAPQDAHDKQARQKPAPPKADEDEIPAKKKAQGEYPYPPCSLLKANTSNTGIGAAQIQENARRLEEALASFSVEAKVVSYSRGPAITRYELMPAPGVRISRIANLSDDIALHLAATGVRIEAPIPGKSAIGIEIPNADTAMVTLREMIESEEFSRHKSNIAFVLGKDIAGNNIVADLARMPHLLIAGTTGSGKSVCINSLIISLLYKSSPRDLQMIMIDPKIVELRGYNGIPHLKFDVVTDPRKAAGVLGWALGEMARRYKLFSDKSVRDLARYNQLAAEMGEEPIPKFVIIIDELSDLMMVSPKEVEDAICRLAQMARAAGMHIVIATQRPSVDVITGLIKANIASRIAFAVAAQVDSRTILDASGAEKLLGRGDMLFHPNGSGKPVRVQGAFVSETEVEAVVDYIREHYDQEPADRISLSDIESILEDDSGNDKDKGYEYDELMPKALELAIDYGQASASLFQRRFRVGYARAARLLDEMEQAGFVSPNEGSKPRSVLISKLEFERLFGQGRVASEPVEDEI